MKRAAWALGSLVLVVLAVVFARRSSHDPDAFVRDATPAEASVSVRVGEGITFAAPSEGALSHAWSLWDEVVSNEATWSFVPGPEDVGWQQVTLAVVGADGQRRERSWNVGVVALAPPEVTDTMPPPGRVSPSAGSQVTFRCGARVPAAREGDRLRFDWTLDGMPIHHDELPATGALSQVSVTATPGLHRVAVHVREVEQLSSFAEWTVDVPSAETAVAAERPETPVEVARADVPTAPTPPGTTVASPPPPPVPAPPPATPAVSPPPAAPPVMESAPTTTPAAPRSPETTIKVVSAPPPSTTPPIRLVRDPTRAEVRLLTGEALALRARVEPVSGPTRYRWAVDGQVVKEGDASRFDYLPVEPGRHRITVTALAGDREVGSGAWAVVARAPEPAAPPTPPPSIVATTPPAAEPPVVAAVKPVPEATPPERAAVPAPAAGSLGEDEVRRWLADYAAAWSRKDVETLQRMGQVRSGSEADRLSRYFKSIDDLRVEVRVIALRIDGERAAVEFERTDTVVDPAGLRRELRLPPSRKQIERTPQGLRFVATGPG